MIQQISNGERTSEQPASCSEGACETSYSEAHLHRRGSSTMNKAQVAMVFFINYFLHVKEQIRFFA
jgi:hypothetical protein